MMVKCGCARGDLRGLSERTTKSRGRQPFRRLFAAAMEPMRPLCKTKRAHRFDMPVEVYSNTKGTFGWRAPCGEDKTPCIADNVRPFNGPRRGIRLLGCRHLNLQHHVTISFPALRGAMSADCAKPMYSYYTMPTEKIKTRRSRFSE